MKNIFLMRRTGTYDGYDEYDEVILIAKTAEQAEKIVLDSYRFEKGKIRCILVGVANEDQNFGVLVASFNAS